jgi:hypothetical protein
MHLRKFKNSFPSGGKNCGDSATRKKTDDFSVSIVSEPQVELLTIPSTVVCGCFFHASEFPPCTVTEVWAAVGKQPKTDSNITTAQFCEALALGDSSTWLLL